MLGAGDVISLHLREFPLAPYRYRFEVRDGTTVAQLVNVLDEFFAKLHLKDYPQQLRDSVGAYCLKDDQILADLDYEGDCVPRLTQVFQGLALALEVQRDPSIDAEKRLLIQQASADSLAQRRFLPPIMSAARSKPDLWPYRTWILDLISFVTQPKGPMP